MNYLTKFTNRIFTFERVCLTSTNGPQLKENCGLYLYKNVTTNKVVSSRKSPYCENSQIIKHPRFTGNDIGYNACMNCKKCKL